MLTFESKTVVITGAAGGLGRAFALELAKQKAHLILSDVQIPLLEETARLAAELGAASVRATRCDVSMLSEIQELYEFADVPVHLLINNAGVCAEGAVDQIDVKNWNWNLKINLNGVFYGCHTFLPKFKSQGFGHILNVASLAGIAHPPHLVAYNVSKAGVISISETLNQELRGSGVGVTVLCPSFFQTNISRATRFVDPSQSKIANYMIDHGPKAEVIAKAALSAVLKNEFYCYPTAEAKFIRFMKVFLPKCFEWIVRRSKKQIEGKVQNA